jgi:hypothetical protein
VRIKTRSLLAAGTLLTTMPPTALIAQTIPRGAGIADRARPLYEPVGIRAGSAFIYPRLTAELEGNDNIRASERSRISDLMLRLGPELRLLAEREDAVIEARAYAARTQFLRTGTESRTEYGTTARIQYNPTYNQSLFADAGAERLFQRRTDINSIDAARRPIAFDRLGAHLGYRLDLPALRFDGNIRATRYDFKDAVSFAGAPLDQDYRDFDRFEVDAKFGVPLDARVAVFFRVAGDRRVYDRQPGDRDFRLGIDRDRNSAGYRLEGGLDVAITDILYAEFGAGYLRQNYASASLKDVDGLSASAALLWNPTQLTSYRLSGERRVDETSTVDVAGRLRTEFEASVEHELMRNLIIGAGTRYGRMKFSGIDRRTRDYGGTLTARYLASRLTTFNLTLEHVTRAATLPGDRYKVNRLLVGMTLTP